MMQVGGCAQAAYPQIYAQCIAEMTILMLLPS